MKNGLLIIAIPTLGGRKNTGGLAQRIICIVELRRRCDFLSLKLRIWHNQVKIASFASHTLGLGISG